MTVLIYDGINDYCLYRTDDLEGLKQAIADYMADDSVLPDPEKHQLICNQDEIYRDVAEKIADEVLHTEDFDDNGIQIPEDIIIRLFEKMRELEDKANEKHFDGSDYYQQSQGAYEMLQILELGRKYIRWDQRRKKDA